MLIPKPIKKWKQAERAANAARRNADILEAKAQRCPLPKRLREARASDIRVGAVIWYKHGGDEDKGFWAMVYEIRSPNDPFKAYMAWDGNRYGLDDAWVQVGK
jgi:hypothetical protein